MKPGTYTISVTQNGVTSNTVTVDIKASPLADASIVSRRFQRLVRAGSIVGKLVFLHPKTIRLRMLKPPFRTILFRWIRRGKTQILWQDRASSSPSTASFRSRPFRIKREIMSSCCGIPTSAKYIILEGFPIPFGNCDANVTGRAASK